MSRLDKLLEIASPSLSEEIASTSSIDDKDLFGLLARKNGFFAFEYALEVFPCGASALSYPVTEWNSQTLWHDAYNDLAPKGFCFAQDAFGGQFVLSDSIYFFDPETGELETFANDLEEWANNVLCNHDAATGYSLAHEWQSAQGRIVPRNRLTPIAPFVLGGEVCAKNLVQMNAVKSLRLRGSLAQKIRNLPDGSKIIYEVTE